MTKTTIDAMVEGGAASAGPPLGPALGPLGVDIGAVIEKINEATKDYKGIKIPVKVIIEKDTKEIEIEVGSPPTSELLKKEAGIEKGRVEKDQEDVGDLTLEQVIKVAKAKKSGILGKGLKNITKEVLGSCVSIGLTCNGKSPKEVIKEINNGAHDSLFGE